MRSADVDPRRGKHARPADNNTAATVEVSVEFGQCSIVVTISNFDNCFKSLWADCLFIPDAHEKRRKDTSLVAAAVPRSQYNEVGAVGHALQIVFFQLNPVASARPIDRFHVLDDKPLQPLRNSVL